MKKIEKKDDFYCNIDKFKLELTCECGGKMVNSGGIVTYNSCQYDVQCKDCGKYSSYEIRFNLHEREAIQ